MIEKISQNQIADYLAKTANKQDSADAPVPTTDGDASLQVDFGTLIDKAAEAGPSDAKAVERAKQLLLSGQLDTEKNIAEAAENILKFGV